MVVAGGAWSQMDWNYSFGILSFIIGSLAGFQGVYEVYGPYSGRALMVRPGIFYLVTRGLFPAIVFAAFYHYRIVVQFLWLQAIACGGGWEVFARSKIYIKKVRPADDGVEDLLKGPLNLVRWYQGLFLKLIDGTFAKEKIVFIQRNLPQGVNFPKLSSRILNRIEAWTDDELKTKVRSGITRLATTYDTEKKAVLNSELDEFDEKFRYTLCYMLLNLVTKSEIITLMSS